MGRYIWLRAGCREGGGTKKQSRSRGRATNFRRKRSSWNWAPFSGVLRFFLAGSRKLKGSGHVHCVDPFAATGDAFSVPIYQRSLGRLVCR